MVRSTDAKPYQSAEVGEVCLECQLAFCFHISTSIEHILEGSRLNNDAARDSLVGSTARKEAHQMSGQSSGRSGVWSAYAGGFLPNADNYHGLGGCKERESMCYQSNRRINRSNRRINRAVSRLYNRLVWRINWSIHVGGKSL